MVAQNKLFENLWNNHCKEWIKEEFVFFHALTHHIGKEGVKELLFSSCYVALFILGDCRFFTPGTRV